MRISDKDIINYISQFKSRENITIVCDKCDKDYFRTKKEIQNSLNKGIIKSFCSRKCHHLYQSNKKLYICKNCNEDVLKRPSQIRGNVFCSQTCAAKYNNQFKIKKVNKRVFSKIAKENIKKARITWFEKIKEKYYISPVLCKTCNEIISYENRKKIYCSNRCKPFSKGRKAYQKKTSICKGRDCLIILGGKKGYCNKCRYEYYEVYKPSCKFQFNLKQYSNLIEGIEHLKILGRYSPSNRKNNLNGASFDHMYSIKDGYLNKVDCYIISHPANCKIMPHLENNLKNTESSITLQELLKRIELFDNIKTEV